MLYGLKIAWRYLTATKTQTGLLVLGVAVGVFVFIFMSALIGGLASYLIDRTLGNVAHITIEAPDRDPEQLVGTAGEVLLVTQKSNGQREVLRTADAFLPVIAGQPGMAVTSQQIVGNGFLVRGERSAPVSVTGVEPDKVSAIADIEGGLVAGSTDLSNGGILLGAKLADDLGVAVGQVVRLQSERGVELALSIMGTFQLGIDSLDSRVGYVGLPTARTLFELPQGLTRIEVKLDELNEADALTARIAADTGLAATSWTTSNTQLTDGLRAQARSGDLIKGFALVTIVIGVASALLLSTYRRRSEIGIMRAMGASRGFVLFVFVTQGALIGILGGVVGAGLAYLALSPFPPPEQAGSAGLPIDVRQGGFMLAIVLTALGATLASILPARSAARVDPVEVIGQ